MEVYGQSGYVVTVKKDDIRVRRAEDKQEEQLAAKPVPAPYDNELSYFRAVILDGAKEDGLSSLETNVTVTEILDAARRSAQKGKIVLLPPGRYAGVPLGWFGDHLLLRSLKRRELAIPTNKSLARTYSSALKASGNPRSRSVATSECSPMMSQHDIACQPMQIYSSTHRQHRICGMLRDHCRNHSGKNVSRATGGHSGIPGGVNPCIAIGLYHQGPDFP